STPKELKQAKDLLAEHDLATCRLIVDFAVDHAAQPNFKMRHFGAVLGYVPEALVSLEQSRTRQLREEQDRRRHQEEMEAFKQRPVNVEGLLKLTVGRFKLDHRREPTAAEIDELRRELSGRRDTHP